MLANHIDLANVSVESHQARLLDPLIGELDLGGELRVAIRALVADLAVTHEIDALAAARAGKGSGERADGCHDRMRQGRLCR